MKKDIKQEKLRLKEMMKINKTNLSLDMSRNPSYIFRMGCLKNDAERFYKKTENELKTVESAVYRKLKSKMTGSTETEIKHRLAGHAQVKIAQENILEAQHMFNMYKVAVKALDDKSTMLTNLAYNYRKELEHNLVKESREKQLMDKAKQS